MPPLKILGIYRHPAFSNNAVEADRLILEAALARLEIASPLPISVEMKEESEAASFQGVYALTLTMAQSDETLCAIDRSFPGAEIWNSTTAIRNCYRKTMSALLSKEEVGYVPFSLLPTDGSADLSLASDTAYWLKRSDFHAIADEDVTLAESAGEVKEKLKRFSSRGVKEVILQRHIHGDIYKFYGVAGRFFHPVRVRKFLENEVTPNLAQLEKVSAKAAQALGLQIYGGDAILDHNGNFHLIDVNDWPSFRLCRDDAATAIADLCVSYLKGLKVPRNAPLAATLSHP